MSDTPTPQRKPCRECGGMGVKTFDIIVGGTEHDTEDVPCERCKDTEGFEPESDRPSAPPASLPSKTLGDAYNTVLGIIEVARTEEPETAFSRVMLQRARYVRDIIEPLVQHPPLPASAPTVTRYRWDLHKGIIPNVDGKWVLYAEVASVLTALAEVERDLNYYKPIAERLMATAPEAVRKLHVQIKALITRAEQAEAALGDRAHNQPT